MRKKEIKKLSNKEKIMLKLLTALIITGNVAYGEAIEIQNPDGEKIEKVEVTKQPDGTYKGTIKDGVIVNGGNNKGVLHTKSDKSKDTYVYEFEGSAIFDGTGLNIHQSIVAGHDDHTQPGNHESEDNIQIKLAENSTVQFLTDGAHAIKVYDSDSTDGKSYVNINDKDNKHGTLIFKNSSQQYNYDDEEVDYGSGISALGGDVNIYAENLAFSGEKNSGNQIYAKDSAGINIGLSGTFYSNAHSTLNAQESDVNIEAKDFIIDSAFIEGAYDYFNHYDMKVKNGTLNIKADNINIDSNNIILNGDNANINLEAEKDIILKSSNTSSTTGNAKLLMIENGSTVTIKSKNGNIKLEGKKSQADSISDSSLSLISNTLEIIGSQFFVSKSISDMKAKDYITIKNSWINIFNSSTLNITGKFLHAENIEFDSKMNATSNIDTEKNIIKFSNPSNDYSRFNWINSFSNGNINVKFDKNIIEARIEASAYGKVNINFNGDFDENRKSSFLGISAKEDDTGVINLGFSNGAEWNIFGDNRGKETRTAEVTNLTLDKGIINFNYENKDRGIEEHAYDLVVDNLKGNGGTFILGVSGEDINHEKPYITDDSNNSQVNENKKTDFIEIKNADEKQTHYIQIADNSIDNIKNHDFEEGKKAIWIADADENVTFEGIETESLSNIYNYKVGLDKNVAERGENISANGNNWYITNVEKSKNEVGESVNRDLSFLYEAAISRLEVDSIHERLGEVRNYDKPHGVWFRTTAGDIKSEDFRNEYNLIQVGYDKQNTIKNGRTFTGFAFNQRKNKLSFDNGDGNSENLGFTVYKSYVGDNGLYVDALAKTTYIDTEYKISNGTEAMKADYDTWAETISLEIGKKYSSKEDNSFIIPHAQLNYSFIKGEDYTTNTDIKVKQNDINSLIGKVGIYAGRDFGNSTHYMKISRLYEFKGDYGMTLADKHDSYSEKTSGEESWTEMGIGGTFQVDKAGDVHMYYSLDRTFGSRYEKQWEGTIGVRITF